VVLQSNFQAEPTGRRIGCRGCKAMGKVNSRVYLRSNVCFSKGILSVSDPSKRFFFSGLCVA